MSQVEGINQSACRDKVRVGNIVILGNGINSRSAQNFTALSDQDHYLSCYRIIFKSVRNQHSVPSCLLASDETEAYFGLKNERIIVIN